MKYSVLLVITITSIINFALAYYVDSIKASKFSLREVRKICNDKIISIYVSRSEIYGKCGGDIPFKFSVENYNK